MSGACPLWTLAAITFGIFFRHDDDAWSLSSHFTIAMRFIFFIPPFLCSFHRIPDGRWLKGSLAEHRCCWGTYDSTGLKGKF
jgi:hypothetical protein